ncbi:histidine phosphatase family protein [Pseudomonas sp. B329]|uniref:histidine phosphatase family protein n=1 Tax=Pseudomonas sp. B329 TaxID=1553459 RepID=UPI002002EEFD|nr:histidine phosphatase family protein [Pseudomonas sp. B329]
MIRAVHTFQRKRLPESPCIALADIVGIGYPQLWSQNITRLWDAGPTGGESISDVVKRVRDGLAELESKYPSKTFLLVAPGFFKKVV